MNVGEALVIHGAAVKQRAIPVTMMGEVLGEDANGSITIQMTSTDARIAAKRLVDMADIIDIESFVEDGAPLQPSDCE